MIFDYQEICQDLLKDLPKRAREIIVRRFGLKNPQKETLQAIGDDLGISRERVRQIQETTFLKLKSKTKRHKPVFSFFYNQLKTSGNLRKEETLLEILSPQAFGNQVFFLLSLSDEFERHLETRDFYSFWTIDQDSPKIAKKTIKDLSQKLRKINRPLEIEEMISLSELKLPFFLSCLEISKEILKSSEEVWGLREWPEINPKGVRDKALLVFKKEKRPLHFNELASLISENDLFHPQKKVLSQTVHNELIKDERFVLVGRGIYALRDWGYKPGTVKDIIFEVLEEAEKPLSKEEIIERVLKQRVVSKNTILINLYNKKYFKRNSEGKYETLK